jgi:hypothetical protein
VEDVLARVGARDLVQLHAGDAERMADRDGDAPSRQDDLRELVVRDVEVVAQVRARDDERVARCRGRGVEEREYKRVVLHDPRR